MEPVWRPGRSIGEHSAPGLISWLQLSEARRLVRVVRATPVSPTYSKAQTPNALVWHLYAQTCFGKLWSDYQLVELCLSACLPACRSPSRRPQKFVRDLVLRGCFSGRVLDAGCGIGDNALFIAKACPQAHVTAVDVVGLGPGMIQARLSGHPHMARGRCEATCAPEH